MMEFIRERAKGLVAIAIIGLLCLTFLLWGIESYISAAQQVIVAKVNGEEIPLAEFQKSFDRMRSRAQSEQGAEYDADLWTQESTKQKALDALIDERLVYQLIDQARLRLSHDQVTQFIANAEAFQVDGKFSADRFKQIAQSMGLSEAGVEKQVRLDLAQQQLRAGVSLSAFSLKGEAEELAQLLDQKRDVAYAMIKPAEPASVTVTDEELSKFYDTHQESFRTPEMVAVEFVELKLEDLKSEVKVEESALNEYYEAHKAQYTAPEERSVNHVLVRVKRNAPEAEVAAAKLKAETLRALIAAGGQTIEQVAREASDDVGSKADGGATGFFPRGVMAPEFEEASFALKVGELGQPVRTDFGFHIIRVKEARPGGLKPFADAKADVEAAYRTEQAETLFFERAEQFTDAVNEHPDSLSAAGEQLNLKPATLGLSTRDALTTRFSTGVASAAWEPEVLNEGLATAPIEIGSTRLVALRVTTHEPSKVPSLAELKDTVTEQLRQQKARDAAKARGDALVARLQKGEAVDALMAAEKLEWVVVKGANRESADLNRALARAAFRVALKDAGASSYFGQMLGTGSYAVVLVSNLDLPKAETLEGRKLDVIQRDTERVRMMAAWRDYTTQLRETGAVKTYPKAL